MIVIRQIPDDYRACQEYPPLFYALHTHVSEQWAVIYDQPIVLGRRQAGAAIEGALRQEVVDELKRVSVDTHGYTDFAMALAALLGFELCPRLSHLKDRRLHVPNNIIVPPSLSGVVRRDVDSLRIDPQ